MHRVPEESAGQGRLHGRALQVLGAFAVVATVVALWLSGVFGEEPERDPVDASGASMSPFFSAEPESPSVPSAGSPASTSLESPSAAPTSAAETTSAAEEAPETSEAAEPTEEHDQGNGNDIECTAYLSLQWSDGDWVGVSVEVVNTGSDELDYWEIELDLRDADIEQYWNMRDTGRDEFGAEDSNARLDPGENTIAGFQAEVDRGFELPDSAPCSAWR